MAQEKYEYQRLYMQKLREKAGTVLHILETSGLPVSNDIRERILGCQDPIILDTWLVEAFHVESAEELFGPGQVWTYGPTGPSRPKPQKPELAGGADGQPDLRERRAR
ncbi:hypothetical protein [Nonomuraea sp. NPDC049784]|uniref:hypothetical protein n=1 Tax=Nonomuraea sp. NPDC049784 TaxID=3154361 RepID=UPI0034108509